MNLLIDTALKGSILILAAAAASYLLRGRSAAARHAAWTAAVVGHLALPALALMMPEWKLPLIPSPSWMEASAPVVAPVTETKTTSTSAAGPVAPIVPVANAEKNAASTPAVPTAVGAPSISSRINSRVRAANIPPVVLLWLLGSTIVLLRLAVGTWKVGRLAKEGDRVDDGEWLSLATRLSNRLGITRPLTLLRGDKLAVPVTWGVVYPAVLLPPDSTDWPEERRRFVLVHEMAHVKRFDALTQLLAQFAIALFWFDPLIWLAAHRMRVEREHACDDYVLRDGTKPSLYAGELLEMVQAIGTPRRESAAPAFAALAMARRSEFEGRMLAILDSRQDRHMLGRSSAIAASVMLGLLIFPLAALRPFAARTASAAPATAVSQKQSGAMPASAEDGRPNLNYSEALCDSAVRAKDGQVTNNIHTDTGDDNGIPVLEYVSIGPARCTQAALVGMTLFADDRLISLGDESYVTIKEVTPSSNRSVRITRRANGTMQFASARNGASVPFDDSMRSWLSRLLPEVLAESGVDVPQRVARDLARGGVPAVLRRIEGIKSTSSRRAHYEALLDGRPLTHAEYDQIARHATVALATEDLSAVLTRIAAGPAKGTKSLGEAVATLGRAQEAMSNALESALDKSKSSGDTASTLTRYGISDDPDMLLLALNGAIDISSDGDKRVLLQTLAAGALRRGVPALRKAWFDAAETISSDTDMRVALQTALPYGHHDPLVVTRVFDLVGERMSSDMEKRVVLQTALAQKLVRTQKHREDFMRAAKTISSSSELAIVMSAAAAAKQ